MLSRKIVYGKLVAKVKIVLKTEYGMNKSALEKKINAAGNPSVSNLVKKRDYWIKMLKYQILSLNSALYLIITNLRMIYLMQR